MCCGDEQVEQAWGSWQRARKEYRCCACAETIRRGDRYHREATKYEGRFTTFKHCARCWRLFLHLCAYSLGDAVLYTLDCGEPYVAPDDDPGHALAFMTSEEGQEWAREQR